MTRRSTYIARTGPLRDQGDSDKRRWSINAKLRAVLVCLSLFAVFLPAMPAANANDQLTTTMAEVVESIGADALYDLGVSGAGIDIAVIDTGVNAVPGLHGANKVIHGPDLSFEAGNPALYAHDSFGHGTAMASIIAGNDGDGGYQGVAPGSRILSMKVAGDSGAVDVSQVIAALDWVTEYGQSDGLNVRVINLAYVTHSVHPYEIDPLAAAVERAWQAGYVVVTSAGNDGASADGLSSPAADPFVIAVAASEGDDVAGFSTVGTDRLPDLMAPGYQLLALAAPGSRLAQENPKAIIDDRFLRGSGTSQAAAVVAGSAALLLEQRPELTPDQVKALLITGALRQPGTGIDSFFEAAPADRDTAIVADLMDEVDALFASWDGSDRSAIDFDTPGGSGQVDLARSAALPALAVTQNHATSDGSGSLEGSRGGNHIIFADGSILKGEVTFTGSSWSGSSWSGSSWSGSSWSGSSWSGSSWSGSSWSGSSWSGSSWSGSSWSGSSWSGSSWSGSSWSGSSWSGSSWSGSSWSGSSWS